MPSPEETDDAHRKATILADSKAVPRGLSGQRKDLPGSNPQPLANGDVHLLGLLPPARHKALAPHPDARREDLPDARGSRAVVPGAAEVGAVRSERVLREVPAGARGVFPAPGPPVPRRGVGASVATQGASRRSARSLPNGGASRRGSWSERSDQARGRGGFAEPRAVGEARSRSERKRRIARGGTRAGRSLRDTRPAAAAGADLSVGAVPHTPLEGSRLLLSHRARRRHRSLSSGARGGT